MSDLSSPQHPLWATVRFVSLVVATTFVLWKNANNFDETEIKAILEIALLAGGYEGLSSWWSSMKAKK